MIKGTGRSPYPKRSRSRAFPVVVVLALVAVAGLFYLRVIDGCEEPSEVPLVSEAGEPRAADAEPDESQPAREDEEAAAPPLAPETIPLPSLEESDPLIRELAGEASARSEFRAWLAAPELVRRFVAGVASVANGESPRQQLFFLAQEERFRVVQQDGHLIADPRSHARYDIATDVFASLDVPTLVRAYRLLQPLFEEAFADLGIPERSFEVTLGQAIRELLGAPRIEGAVELRRVGSFYEYSDEELESLSPAQRHLLRMGPRNALRIQAKLREIQNQLGLAEDDG
jgi:hypothetical protein